MSGYYASLIEYVQNFSVEIIQLAKYKGHSDAAETQFARSWPITEFRFDAQYSAYRLMQEDGSLQ